MNHLKEDGSREEALGRLLELNIELKDLRYKQRVALDERARLMSHVSVNPLSEASLTIRHINEGDKIFVFDTETGGAFTLTIAVISSDDLAILDDRDTWHSLESIGVIANNDGNWSKCVSIKDDLYNLTWAVMNPPDLEKAMTKQFAESVTLHLKQRHRVTIVSTDEDGVPSFYIDRSV